MAKIQQKNDEKQEEKAKGKKRSPDSARTGFISISPHQRSALIRGKYSVSPLMDRTKLQMIKIQKKMDYRRE